MLTDRSRIECAQKCLRKRYWEYEYQGRGVVPLQAESVALCIGSAVHAGINALPDVDAAIRAVGFELGPLLADDRCLEYLSLSQALVYAWNVERLPKLVEEYEILSSEQEEEPFDIGSGVMLMVRTDKILKRRSDGAVFVWNAKTTKICDDKWRKLWEFDPQTLSECLPVEKRLGRPVDGVLIEGIQKGMELEYPQGSGNKYYNSPLIWAWENGGAWTPRYEWTDESGTHRLGKGWTKKAIWREYPLGVEGWVNYLKINHPQVLTEQFCPLPPILRSAWQVEKWKRQTSWNELNIQHMARYAQTAPPELQMVDVLFPCESGHGNCLWPSPCPYIPLCWMNESPDNRAAFVPRTANHEAERESFANPGTSNQ